MKFKYNLYEPIEIFWLDSTFDSGWGKFKELSLENIETNLDHRTIGYFLAKTKRAITICQSISELEVRGNRSIADNFSIPIKCITKIRRIK